MEIPQEVQNKLKCSECDELLSCGPVYVLHETGGAICGRCSQQPEEKISAENNERTRIEQYEVAASLLAFPCTYAARGCSEKIKFSVGQPPHEFDCKFRPLICPIVPRGSCEWIGSWSKLKEHCTEKHASNILENPFNPPRPDLTTSNLKTYLLSAFHFLFLLQVKVCVTSGKLFHSVRMFGDSELLDKFSFTLKIQANDINFTKSGSVIRAGIMMLQEPSAICTTINSLLDFLDGKYDESKFTITIQSSVTFNCLNCLNKIDYASESKFCEGCQIILKKCKLNEKGCSFVDVYSNKCRKHERYFCEYETKCCLCQVNFVGGSFIEHLGSCRKTIQSNIDSVVRVAPITGSSSSSSRNYFILFSSNNIGTIICEYRLCDSNLTLYLRTSLPSNELKHFKCSIKLTDPETKHTQVLTPQIQYKSSTYDWLINEKIHNFPSWQNQGINMKINIEKNVN